MKPTVDVLLTSALELSPTEREELADRIWESLQPQDGFGGMSEDEFAAELDRRAAELRADPSQGVPWDEVQKMR
jgi:putative addiction module component (TIGR02574 family)